MFHPSGVDFRQQQGGELDLLAVSYITDNEVESCGIGHKKGGASHLHATYTLS
jgi:hypothetical protein